PITPIPLTGAVNSYHLGEGSGEHDFWGKRRPGSGSDLQMEAAYWPGLMFCQDAITIECWIKSDDLGFSALDLLDGEKGIQIYCSAGNPSGGIRFQFYLETEVPHQFERTELTTEIMLSANKWTHIAFTYDKSTGIIRIFADGIPAWITHVDPEHGGIVEQIPWTDHWQGEPGRALVLQENLNLLVTTHNDTIGTAIDELRITAENLYPPRFLNVGPTICVPPMAADLDGDCDVDLFDMAILLNNWLACNNVDPAECFK
ncbi:MAG: LamG domain-containing protein, partial [Planctomycetes bacterium]|nr:LamG domain-containing protein [Planctomycetota bacterium]